MTSLACLAFGASVTQQGNESGYCTHLRNTGVFSRFRQFGIGGCHFNDAGYYLLDEAIGSESFDICILDWNSTWQGCFDRIRLESVIKRLLCHGILPIFAILPTRLNCTSRPSEALISEFAQLYNIPFLDLRMGCDLDLMLRDEYHTNEYGALFIAREIHDFVSKLNLNKVFDSISYPTEKYADVQKVLAYEIKRTLKRDEVLSIGLNRLELDRPVDLTVDMTIGPFSSFMGMSHDGVKVATYQIWDMWCHYERRKLFQLINIEKRTSIPSNLEICIEPGLIDYSVCRRPDFSYHGALELRIDRLYSTNLSLSVRHSL